VTAIEARSAGRKLPTGTALTVLATVAVLTLLYFGRAFFVAVVASITLAAVLDPSVRRLSRLLRSRTVAALVAVLVTAAATLAMAYAAVVQLGVTVERVPTVLRLAARDIARLAEPGGGTMKHTRAALAELDRSVAKVTGDAPALPPRKPSLVAEAADWVRDHLVASTLNLFQVLLQVGVVTLMTFFLLCSGEALLRGTQARMRPSQAASPDLGRSVRELGRQVRLYGGVLVLTNIVLGLGVWAAFLALGVPDAWAWGLVAAALHFLPYVGLAILMLLGAIEVYAVQASIAMALVAASLVGLLGIVVGTAMTASLQARAAKVDSATMFVGTVFWSVWWGGWGLVLGPVLVVAMLVGRDWLMPVAALPEAPALDPPATPQPVKP
jgi:predicted PurR-regulated permease PerM